MVSMIMLVVIGLCTGWALDAFAHGNSYLAEGKFDEAIAAFHQARELDPKRAHVAERLAEVERRQYAASATLPANGPS